MRCRYCFEHILGLHAAKIRKALLNLRISLKRTWNPCIVILKSLWTLWAFQSLLFNLTQRPQCLPLSTCRASRADGRGFTHQGSLVGCRGSIRDPNAWGPRPSYVTLETPFIRNRLVIWKAVQHGCSCESVATWLSSECSIDADV